MTHLNTSSNTHFCAIIVNTFSGVLRILSACVLVIGASSVHAVCTTNPSGTTISSMVIISSPPGCYVNNGTITAGGTAIGPGANNQIFTNNSIVYGSYSGIYSNTYTYDAITNANLATIEGGSNGINVLGTSIATISNSGNIFGGTVGIGVNASNINSLANTASGKIYSTSGVGINMAWGRTISSLDNSGEIYGATYGVYSQGGIGTLTNTGAIYGGSNPGIFIASWGSGTITTLNNAQGSSNTHSALTYSGVLPNNYNIIVNSTSAFGQLSASSISGSTTFGINSSSTLAANTYSSVLTGLLSSNITNYSSIHNIWNNFNSQYKWQLVDGANSTTWGLQVALRATNMTAAGSPYYTVNLGSTVNPVFDGGTLIVSAAGSVTPSFTIMANNGTIDQNGVSSNFTGNIVNAGVGVNGKLTILNGGTAGQGVVVLSGANTHSGGTEVQAGATLSIGSADALGSGTLALVGSATVPATLATTSSMTISNPITVTGDPVFNVASGTTTTVSTGISGSGDVEVSGGGTLALTAANTYTGPTIIDSGSTLALSGAGSITPSSALTNNGTLNVTSKTGNVSLGGTFTQSASGSLLMNFSPANNQRVLVTGAASLAGTLNLNASSGTYLPGRYTLLTANGVSGTFGSLTTNLSSYTSLGYILGYDANGVYLIFNPNTADTQSSVVNTAAALQNTYTLQNSVLANSFTYDCTLFDKNNVCVSAGGRNTAVSAANGLNNTSALLIAAYRPHPNYRVGAYADQNLFVNNAGSTVNLGNNTPVIGVFGAWNENVDGTGTEVKVSAAYGQKNTTITRTVVGASEAGSGGSQLNSQGAQVVAKYGFGVMEDVIVSPYAGMRYTQNNMGGYTEGTSATVTAPLTYSALNTNATTALAGVGASYRGIPQTNLFASAGVETDTNTANGTYSATGVSGLTPVNFNANPVKTRPTAMLGATYDVAKNQRLGVTGIYRQEAYQAVSTTSVMATYTIGL